MKLKKIQDATVENILKTYTPSKDIQKVTNLNMAPDEFIQAAIAHKLYLDGVIFLAHALPMRESIYWAWLTVSELKEKFSDNTSTAIIKAVKDWFTNSDEASRRLCGELAEDLKLETGPAWLAESVFWSGGSILGPKDPETPAPPHLYAQAVVGAISLSISLDETDENKILENYISSLKIAINLAQGGNGK